MDIESTFLRSESRRIDDKALAASFAFESNESSSLSCPRCFLPSTLDASEGSSTLCAKGLQTDIGKISRGGSAVLLGGLLVTAARGERSYGPVTSETSATG